MASWQSPCEIDYYETSLELSDIKSPNISDFIQLHGEVQAKQNDTKPVPIRRLEWSICIQIKISGSNVPIFPNSIFDIKTFSMISDLL